MGLAPNSAAPIPAPAHTAVTRRDNFMAHSLRTSCVRSRSLQAGPQETRLVRTASGRPAPIGYAARVLIVIEGVDGAGKRTLTNGLRAAFEAAHRSVASLAFPRYEQSVEADLAAEALRGGHGDLAQSVYAMAVLFALDRRGARDEIARLDSEYDVVILDRYVA